MAKNNARTKRNHRKEGVSPVHKRKKNPPPVNRDVGLQSKGPRLQRLRAVLLLVQQASLYPKVQTFVAVEFQGDVFCSSAEQYGSTEYHEENKNYDKTVAFSMNNENVLKSLVAFCDCWISKGLSPHVKFAFYTPNSYTSESNTSNTTELGITWPDKPMLELLSNDELSYSNVLDAAKKAILNAYAVQVAKHFSEERPPAPRTPLGNLEEIRKWEDSQWTAFFKQIEWKFGEEDSDTILPTIIRAIQSSPFYNEQIAGKEQQIVSVLLDLIDRRQAISDVTQRFMHASECVLAFKDVEAGTVRLPDPAWQLWEKLPAPTDTRNLAGKVTAACPSIDQDALAVWSRRAAKSLIEQRAFRDDKQILALKYQIYDVCDERLTALTRQRAEGGLSSAQLAEAMDDLVALAVQRFNDCERQYSYRLKATSSIQAIVYELFDSCFLSFDGGRPL